MARIHGVLAGLVLSSAVIALPAAGQSRGSASLTHTVSVTVPSRVKVSVTSLAVAAASNKTIARSSEGLSLAVSASKPWVVAIESPFGIAGQKPLIQSSADGLSRFSVLASTLNGRSRGEPVMLTLTAP
jgi:hypothetical protein